MNYIQAPQEDNNHYLFLAGGISNCHNWQSEVVDFLKDYKNLTVINPRRENFDMADKDSSIKQIEWEFKWLNRADTILFWFPKETLCPITLFELGCAVTNNNKNLLIGADPEYKRLHDIDVQVGLRLPLHRIYINFEHLIHVVLPNCLSPFGVTK